jgi:hypothetical protein
MSFSRKFLASIPLPDDDEPDGVHPGATQNVLDGWRARCLLVVHVGIESRAPCGWPAPPEAPPVKSPFSALPSVRIRKAFRTW